MRHPIQPIYKDESGVLRFKSNEIVQYLLDSGSIDMNHLAICNFSQEDREQFAQLIGYSLSGFGELSYVSNETYETASIMSKSGQTEDKARIQHLEEIVGSFKQWLKQIVPTVFRIAEEDLDDFDFS